MADDWLLTLKPSFLHEWLALPPKPAHQVQEKLAALTSDPMPDAKVKKQLKGYAGKVFRLRAGDWRIFYTLDKPHVSVLALRKRDESTYGDEVDEEYLGGPVVDDAVLAPSQGEEPRPVSSSRQDGDRWLEPAGTAKTKLPSAVRKDLLVRLKVPVAFHGALLGIDTEEDLLGCRGVPDEWLARVIDALYPRPLAQVLDQPDLVADSLEDLLRYREGKLVGFLLKLDDEQKKFVTWGASGAGPTLLKGGPGTGKSTIALHRCREMISRGATRVLFSTYTNALVAYSQQLLRGLLGPSADRVTVRTADSIARQVYVAEHGEPAFADTRTLRQTIAAVVGSVVVPGNRLRQRAAHETLGRLGSEYLLEEISRVIIARNLTTLDAYLEAPRAGRKVVLGPSQRGAVWAAYEGFTKALAERKLITWSQLRTEAASLVLAGKGIEGFDAVLIDEVQDLEPASLSMLVSLCADPSRLFLTADANQTIYGSMFRWTDVHTSLRLQGRTGVLRANHRSTREVGEAAFSYLSRGVLDEESSERAYMHQGPLPVVRAVTTEQDELDLLVRYLKGASRAFRLGMGSCAVFCPSEKSGRRIAAALTSANVPAAFTSGRDLNLDYTGVKVLTLASSKGLEFPIVALAGFLDEPHPHLASDLPDEGREEVLLRERRTMYVAMTRAMRALLVIVPGASTSPLLTGFTSELWNLGPEASS